MKKILHITAAILFTISFLTACNINDCESDNEGLCELEMITDFEIEENPQITIAVFNEGYGADLLENWNLTNPLYKDIFNYEVIDFENKEELLLNISKYDLIELRREDVPLYFDYLRPFDPSFSIILENEYLEKFSSQINQEENYFIPFEIEGLLFAYNKTMLENFEVDLTDEDEDGLAEAIDSFEKIAELAQKWRSENKTYLDDKINNIFSFPLNDQMAMLTFLQNADYRLIKGTSAEMMDIDQGLLVALENLKILGSYDWRLDKTLNNDTLWNYEQVLIDQSAPFLLVGNWMYYDHYQQSKAYELVFTKFPKFYDKNLAPIASVTGFVLNKDTKYPKAANALIKHIKGVEGTQVAINNGIIPLINFDLLKVEGFKIEDNTKQQIKAYQYSEPSPLQAFEQNPEIRGWDLILENDIRKPIREVFLGIQNPTTAQSEIKNIFIEWLNEKGLTVEGINDIDKEDQTKTLNKGGQNDDVGKNN